MSGWIKDKADRIQAEREREQSNQEYEKGLKRITVAHAPVAFGRLISAVERDIQEFRECFPDVALGPLEMNNDLTFQVSRKKPAFALTVSLSGELIYYQIQSKGLTQGSFLVYWDVTEARLRRASDKEPLTFEEASRELLNAALP